MPSSATQELPVPLFEDLSGHSNVCYIFSCGVTNVMTDHCSWLWLPQMLRFGNILETHVVFELKLCSVLVCRISSFSDNIIMTNDTILSLFYKAQFLFSFGSEWKEVSDKESITMATVLFAIHTHSIALIYTIIWLYRCIFIGKFLFCQELSSGTRCWYDR